MTRKDYILLADALRRARIETLRTGHDAEGIRIAAIEIAYELKDDNPAFDKERFMKACGIDR